MTTTHQTQSRKSSPTVSGTTDELGAVFKDVLNDEMKKEFSIHLGPAFVGLADSLKHLTENQVKVHTAVIEAKAAAEFGGEQARLAKVAADGAADDARAAANGIKAAPKATVMMANELASLDNIKGDVRTIGVAGVVGLVAYGVVSLFGMVFGDPEPAMAPTVRKAT